jgi:hypothetical protein
LSTKNLSLPKGRARKLAPKYIGPYKIIDAQVDVDTVLLDLPHELVKRRIHPKFHVGLIRPHCANDDENFPRRDASTFYDMGIDDEQEWLVDEILSHEWRDDKSLWLHVRWSLGDTTWEPLANCEELVALDEYLAIRGANKPRDLPKKRAVASDHVTLARKTRR